MTRDNTKIFKALSDPNRLRILKALQIRTLCVCEIRELLDLANSTVSQHLALLKEAGFIVEEKKGKWVDYMINSKPADPRIKSVLSKLDFWISNEKTIAEDRKKIMSLDRNTICSA